jgi:hypothetical protein
MESAFPRGKLAKRSHLHLLLSGWRITWGTQPERRVVCLESYCYNKLDSGHKSTSSLELDEHMHFLICLTSLLDLPKYHLSIIHSQLSVPLGSHLSSRHIVVVLQTSTICPIRACISLISSKYPIWCRSTFEPCRHDLTRGFIYPSCSVIQENVISDRVEDRFSLKVLTLMGDLVLDVGIWESSIPFRAFDWVHGPWRSSNGAQHKESREA